MTTTTRIGRIGSVDTVLLLVWAPASHTQTTRPHPHPGTAGVDHPARPPGQTTRPERPGPWWGGHDRGRSKRGGGGRGGGGAREGGGRGRGGPGGAGHGRGCGRAPQHTHTHTHTH